MFFIPEIQQVSSLLLLSSSRKILEERIKYLENKLNSNQNDIRLRQIEKNFIILKFDKKNQNYLNI